MLRTFQSPRIVKISTIFECKIVIISLLTLVVVTKKNRLIELF